MAQPIPLTVPPRDPQAELLRRLEHAPGEHAAALLDAYEVLEGLHERGVLELLRGALGSSEQVLEIAVGVAKSPQSIRSIRNLVLLVNLVGEIPPEQLRSITQAVPETLQTAQQKRPPGLMKMAWTALWNRDLHRSLWLGMSLLTTIGRNLTTQGSVRRAP